MSGDVRTVRAGLLRTPFAAWWAEIAIIQGVRTLADPNSSQVHALLHNWDALWAVVYILAGVGVLVGLGTWRANIETAGLVLFGAGLLVQLAAAVVFSDYAKTVGWWNIAILASGVLVVIVRARHLWRGEILVWVRRSE